jgi:transposase-like protein
MKKRRKQYSAEFKSRVGLEALLGLRPISDISREYEVHPTQVNKRKREIRERLPEVFEHGDRRCGEKADEKHIEQLHAKIGQLSVEVDWLKKVQAAAHTAERVKMVESGHNKLSIRRQEILSNVVDGNLLSASI